jgi:maleylpyruvate isomerase
MTAPTPLPPREPDRRRAEVAGCRAAHDRLRAGLAGLDDATARGPSALPGWTVGHVLTHLARNADGLRRIVEGVLAGDERAQYPGGAAGRAGDIEAGAGRPAAELVEDVTRAAAALEGAWDRLTDDQWATGVGRTWRGRGVGVSTLPLARWREVEVHHADLGLPSFGWADWSEAYVRTDLVELLGRLQARAGDLPLDDARRLVAVLGGRVDGPVTVPAVVD